MVAGSAARSRLAVVSTMKDVGGRLKSWLAWHTAVGFDAFYLFFDDPDEASSSAVVDATVTATTAGAMVRVIPKNGDLRKAWSAQASWAAMRGFVDSDVQCRQLLNVQSAMERARDDGITWLLHIDSDEIWIPRPPAAGRGAGARETASSCEGATRAHFARLDAAGCECFSYFNYEGVPSPELVTGVAADGRTGEAVDPFALIRVFKSPVVALGESGAAQRAADSWRRRNAAGTFHLYYENVRG